MTTWSSSDKGSLEGPLPGSPGSVFPSAQPHIPSSPPVLHLSPASWLSGRSNASVVDNGDPQSPLPSEAETVIFPEEVTNASDHEGFDFPPQVVNRTPSVSSEGSVSSPGGLKALRAAINRGSPSVTTSRRKRGPEQMETDSGDSEFSESGKRDKENAPPSPQANADRRHIPFRVGFSGPFRNSKRRRTR